MITAHVREVYIENIKYLKGKTANMTKSICDYLYLINKKLQNESGKSKF